MVAPVGTDYLRDKVTGFKTKRRREEEKREKGLFRERKWKEKNQGYRLGDLAGTRANKGIPRACYVC
jgi:hypothetical protein